MGRGVVGRARRVADLHQRPAQLGELARRLDILRPRVAVAEILREVEAQPPRELTALLDGARMALEARGHRLRGGEHVRGVAAPDRLGGIERQVVAQRHERVLQRRARARVGVHVAGGDGRHPEPLRQLGQLAVARAVMALEGPLQLDAQAVRPEGGQQPPQRRLVVHAVVRAAAQQHQPGRVLLQRLERHRGRRLVLVAIVHVGARDDPAEVAPAGRVLHQQRHVAPVGQIHLGAVDRPQPQWLGRHRELHRARDPVVVGHRHRLVPGRGGGRRELRGRRRAVQEGEGRVRVELGVGHEHTFAQIPDAAVPS